MGDFDPDEDPTGMNTMNRLCTDAFNYMGAELSEGFNNPLGDDDSVMANWGRMGFVATMLIPVGGEAKLSLALVKSSLISEAAGAITSVFLSGDVFSGKNWA